MERAVAGKIAAISVGIVDATALLDLEYTEDSGADVDFNVIGTDAGTYVELQATAEGKPFDRSQMDALLELADGGLKTLFDIQGKVLAAESPEK
jgi:ribonuclease PH